MARDIPEEILERILERVSQGVLPAKVLRMEDVDLPASRLAAYRREHPEFDARFEEARLYGCDALAAESLDIIDGLAPVAGVPMEAARDKARADHRLRLLAKLDPKRYGDRVQLADADGEKLQTSPMVLEVMALLRPQRAVEAASEPLALPTYQTTQKGRPDGF